MDDEQLERFITLSERILKEKASTQELDEFQQLLSMWNSTAEFALFQGIESSRL